MSYLEELLPEFRKGAKIRCNNWPDGVYMYVKNGEIFPSHPQLDCNEDWDSDLISDNWELYQEPIDWEYIIDHKCLCWFWFDNSNYAIHLGYLTRLRDSCPNNEGFIYCKDNGMAFKNCRPVRRDEVTFYEDRKDEEA